LALLIVLPLLSTVLFTLSPEAREAWGEVLVGRLSENLIWEPLGATLLIGAVTVVACVLLGGFLAWLVVMTDVPFRRTIGVMATLPFMIPSFATALAWGTLFKNDRLGGERASSWAWASTCRTGSPGE
jgi:iron(III) transport system permease protein